MINISKDLVGLNIIAYIMVCYNITSSHNTSYSSSFRLKNCIFNNSCSWLYRFFTPRLLYDASFFFVLCHSDFIQHVNDNTCHHFDSNNHRKPNKKELRLNTFEQEDDILIILKILVRLFLKLIQIPSKKWWMMTKWRGVVSTLFLCCSMLLHSVLD